MNEENKTLEFDDSDEKLSQVQEIEKFMEVNKHLVAPRKKESWLTKQLRQNKERAEKKRQRAEWNKKQVNPHNLTKFTSKGITTYSVNEDSHNAKVAKIMKKKSRQFSE